MKATIRENLMTTMALYAGEMSANHIITLPQGNDGEDALADYCAACASEYLMELDRYEDYPFCDFAQDKLLDRFGKPITCDDPLFTEDAGEARVIAVAGSVERVLMTGTYAECEAFCDAYDWRWLDENEFEWSLEVES